MSLTLLNKKFEELNDREKKLRQTYDVRGTNKHQHRYIKDLKEDFKEDLILRYGNKPYGLGWNEEEEEEEKDPNEDEDVEEIPDDDEDGDIEKENEDVMTNIVVNNNFRPVSGKNLGSPQNRPFSATSSIRPITAGSTRSPQGNLQFSHGGRPISAIAKINKVAQHGMSNVGDFTMNNKNPQSMYAANQGDYSQGHKLQRQISGNNNERDQQVDDTMFWKNTKKFDISKSTKMFDTKQLVFDIQHSHPKLIASSDLKFLREAKVTPVLNASKLTAPQDHEFHEIAITRPNHLIDQSHPAHGLNQAARSNFEEDDEESEAKVTFNQSLSYIHQLRVDTPSESRFGIGISSFDSGIKSKKLQRPMTAHPTMSTGAVTSTKRAQGKLETINEYIQENRRTYFSSLSDLRKKALFLKLNSLEPVNENHPNSNKELRTVDWEGFKEVTTKEDFQGLHLLLLDFNTFDNIKYELEYKSNGKLVAKDKQENKRDINELFKEFTNATKTNLGLVIVYYETSSNRMIQIFSRVMVYERNEDEYDLMIWKNIYRFLLHKIILSNTALYPECRTYQDFSRMIKDIIEDKNDCIVRVSNQIYGTKEKPIVVERNNHVYNFDLHSYILECSSHYAKALSRGPLKQEELEAFKNKKHQSQESLSKKQRPFSAINPKNQFLQSPANRQLQNIQEVRDNILNDSSHFFEPSLPSPNYKFVSPSQGNRPATSGTLGLSANLISVAEGGQNSRRIQSPNISNVQIRRPQSSIPTRTQTQKLGLDMTLKGDRMEIGGQSVYGAYTTDRGLGGYGHERSLPVMNMGLMRQNQEMQAYGISSPKPVEDMFQTDPNGLVMRYKQAVLKKKPTAVTKRPQSATNIKKQPLKNTIRPHNVDLTGGGSSSMKMLITGIGVHGNR